VLTIAPRPRSSPRCWGLRIEEESKNGVLRFEGSKELRTSYRTLYDDTAVAIITVTAAVAAPMIIMHIKVLHSQYPHYSPRGS
jgi:hypothetical protein